MTIRPRHQLRKFRREPVDLQGGPGRETHQSSCREASGTSVVHSMQSMGKRIGPARLGCGPRKLGAALLVLFVKIYRKWWVSGGDVDAVRFGASRSPVRA